MKKRIGSIVLALTMLVAAAGCGSTTPASEPAAEETTVQETAAEAETKAGTEVTEGETRVVTDVFGREVEIPGKVESAVALGSGARLMCYAGCIDKVVGVTESDLEPDALKPYSLVFADQLKDCTALATGGSNDTDYTEAIIEKNPDIIFYFDSDTVAMDELAAKTGLPVVGIYAKNSFDDTFFDSLDLIGSIMGTKDRTDEVVSALKGWKEDLNSRTADIADADKPVCYAGAVNWSGRHGIEGSYQQYVPLVAVNANNVVDQLGDEGYVEIDREQLTAWDPDVIFLTVGNMDLINEDYAQNPDFYNSLSAVKNGKVFSQVSFNYYWCNLELAVVDAYYCGCVLYPEKFADVDFEKKADEIFTTMLGQPYMSVCKENGMDFKQLTIGE